MTIDLAYFGGTEADGSWGCGEAWSFDGTPAGAARLVADRLTASTARAWLFWDYSLGKPDVRCISRLAELPIDVWHAGLTLGLAGLPGAIDFVTPTWMLNADAPNVIESTSWRLSLRACLIRAEVLRQCGGPIGDFDSLDGAGLELGHRLIKAGVTMRHTPDMTRNTRSSVAKLPMCDELQFLGTRFGTFWNWWAMWRMIAGGYSDLATIVRARYRSGSQTRKANYRRSESSIESSGRHNVTVLIPTIDRYPYLRKVLTQLAAQTVLPAEVVVIDQTREDRRETNFADCCPGLAVRVLYLDQPGQCSARNKGLLSSNGDYVLFIDDDDEVEQDLIERHLNCLADFGSEVSAGVADEVGAGPLPYEFTYLRISDVFPTNNCMIRSTLLERTGLFDLAYDRGQRADGDLGMRAHLSGALMMLNPAISVFHHHAPMGGLRTHKARKITYASSRNSIWQRHLPSSTELYLWRRYFTSRQLREESWMRVLGTLSVRGGLLRKIAKVCIGIVMLPHSWYRLAKANSDASRMLQHHPSIPLWQRSATRVSRSS